MPEGERSGEFLVRLLVLILSLRRWRDPDGGVTAVGAADGMPELLDPLTESTPGVGQSLGSQDQECDYQHDEQVGGLGGALVSMGVL